MGGDDSQKLMPWRGMRPLRGAANLQLTAIPTLARSGRRLHNGLDSSHRLSPKRMIPLGFMIRTWRACR
jgi:hypothetical protein